MLRFVLPALLALSVTLPAVAQTVDARRAAVDATLNQAPACTGLGDVYWEIGDASGRLASGRRGTAITADKPIGIASASKWMWGAYVAERESGTLSREEITALTMSSGYHGLNPLNCKGTVAECGDRGFDTAQIGQFHYDGAHAQRQAAGFGLGGMDGPALANEMRRLLGRDLAFTMRSPQPAGGVIMAPSAYGVFLRKLTAGQLRLSGLLASHAVCTLPGTCPTAAKSPFDRNWHYSLHHWVEDAAGDDGAVSSAGAFGFYPWISGNRATWGLLARHEVAKHAGRASAVCGALMRKAWFAAAPQAGGAVVATDAAPKVYSGAPDRSSTDTAERAHPIRDALRQRMIERGR